MTTPAEALAPAAAFERDARAQHYPGMVSRGEISSVEADEDLQQWRRIEEWLRTGQFSTGVKGQPWQPLAVWRPLERAARKALERREEAARAKPGSAVLADRLRNVGAIHAMLARNADTFEAAR